MEYHWQIMGIDDVSKASITAYKSQGDEGDLRLFAHSKGVWVTLAGATGMSQFDGISTIIVLADLESTLRVHYPGIVTNECGSTLAHDCNTALGKSHLLYVIER
jgi:hypothetical protein